MSKNKGHFTPEKIQERFLKKWDKYYNAFLDPKIKATLDKMPKTQATLDIIEQEMSHLIKDVEAPTERDKWAKFVDGFFEVGNAVIENKDKQD